MRWGLGSQEPLSSVRSLVERMQRVERSARAAPLRWGTVRQVGGGAVALARSGLLGPYRPDHLYAMAAATRRWGVNLGALLALGAARGRDRMAICDDQGSATFAEMDAWTDTAAAYLADHGVGPDQRVGLLCRNGRGFVLALVALAKLGADTVHCNTGFAGPQLRQMMARESITALITDQEFLPLLGSAGPPEGVGPTLVVVADGRPDDPRSFGAILSGEHRGGPPRPRRVGRQVLLTSGTTGEPKGAPRRMGAELEPLVSLLSAIPLRTRDTAVLSAPMFHSWGLVNTVIGLLLGMGLVTSARFDPEHTLSLIEGHRAQVLVAVPVMLQRIMELPPEVRAGYDLSSLRVVAVSGSALPGDLAGRFMDEFGEVVYNLYGSTEIGWASIATPADLRAAPGCAGRVPPGTALRLLDDRGVEVAEGQTGRIFVRSGLLFDGYTGGGGKDVIDGFMSSGDVGHCTAGRLFVDGRDDEMIVSGGENVFPREIEDVLVEQPGVVEAAVIGVEDQAFGQRLHAFVVRQAGYTPSPDARSLLDVVRARLARYKVPRAVTFVDQLPRTTTGKVLKAELLRSLTDPPPG